MSAETAQRDRFVRDLDTNIYKLMESYRLLIRKGQVGTSNVHEQLQVETASSNIVSSPLHLDRSALESLLCVYPHLTVQCPI
jgi:hypothetical protein